MTLSSSHHNHRRGYTVDEAAALYHLSRSRLYIEIQTGRLRSIKIGKSRRILPEHLHEWERSLTATEGGLA